MFQVIHHDSQLCFNASNHESIPADGLVIPPGVWSDVTPQQAEYLQGLGLETRELPDPKPSRAARAHQE